MLLHYLSFKKISFKLNKSLYLRHAYADDVLVNCSSFVVFETFKPKKHKPSTIFWHGDNLNFKSGANLTEVIDACPSHMKAF